MFERRFRVNCSLASITYVCFPTKAAKGTATVQREQVDWSGREFRQRVSLPGFAHRDCGQWVSVLVINMSYTGCRFASDHPFERGETFSLALPNRGRLDAQVRWASDGRVGARFLTGQSSKDARRARLGV